MLSLDEPYSGLDRDRVILVQEMIADTTRRGGSVIIATHEWERAAKAADTVLALAARRLVEMAPTDRFMGGTLAAAAGEAR